MSGVTADNTPVTLRFGNTGVPGYELISSKYLCLITGYSVSINNNYFYYTINCVSIGIKYRDKRFNIPPARNVSDAINYIYQVWNLPKVGIGKYYQLVIDKDAYGHVQPMDIGYSKDEDSNLVPNTNTLNDVTIYEFLDTILSQVEDTDDARAVYWYELNDREDKQAIIIHRTLVTSEEDLSTLTSFTFDWGGNHQDNSTNNLVLSFEAEYQGAVNISTSEDLIEYKHAIDSSGSQISAEGYFEYFVPDYARQQYHRDSKFWSKAATWSYAAQMEICGIPADIPIGAYIEVNPLIYGKKHHTSGIYVIKGARCDISSNGFRTNLDLVKIIVSNGTKAENEGGTWIANINNTIAKGRNFQIYRDKVDKAKTMYYENKDKNRILSVLNTSESDITFSGVDYCYMPTNSAGKYSTPESYNEYDDNEPVDRN